MAGRSASLRGERGIALDVEIRLQLLERLVAEALDPTQIGDALEAAVLGAPRDDALGLGRPDGRQQLQLLLAGGVEVELAGDLLVVRFPGRWLVRLAARPRRRRRWLGDRRRGRRRRGRGASPATAHRGNEQGDRRDGRESPEQ